MEGMTNKETPKICLTMIAKNREAIIERALNSTRGVFDYYVLQDTGSTDKTIEVFKNWCELNNKSYKVAQRKDYDFVEVNGQKLLARFDEARNDSFKLARETDADFVFWMDTDDILINPQLIPAITQSMRDNGEDIGILIYDYAKINNNVAAVTQKRERIINLKIPGKWKNWVHENYQPEGTVKPRMVEEIKVEHKRGHEEVLETGRRNNLIMHKQLKEEGIESFDDNQLNNLAFDHWEHKEYEDAIKYYEILINRKHQLPVEHAYHILLKICVAHKGLSKLEDAIVWANKAIKLIPGMADGYLNLAEIYADLGLWDEAVYFADKVIAIGKPNTTAPINDMDYTIIPLRIKMIDAINRSNYDTALGLIDKMIQILPDSSLKREKSDIENRKLTSDAINGVNGILKYLQFNNLTGDSDRLLAAIPKDLKENDTVRQIIKELKYDFKRKSSIIKLKGKKSIVIYAGRHYEEWDGNSDIERGIGGSEGMCILMARELAKLGNDVFVYNESKGGKFDGVEYINWSKWSETLKSDVFISLRQPQVFEKMIKAKKVYLWLHDTYYGDLPRTFFYGCNNIIVLSDAHKQVIQQEHGVTNESVFWVSRNALNPVALEYADKNKGGRNNKQMIYASSYDRGLDNLLSMWPKIKREVPEATLKIFYGWNTYDAMMKARVGTQQGQQMQQYKSQIIEMISKLDGVQELGRIPEPELYKEFGESSVWFYPTEFYEISCRNAMAAQAMGCIPVCTPHAALNETVNTEFGMKMRLENISDSLIWLLNNEDEMESRRGKLAKWARKQFDAAKLAKEWNLHFNEK